MNVQPLWRTRRECSCSIPHLQSGSFTASHTDRCSLTIRHGSLRTVTTMLNMDSVLLCLSVLLTLLRNNFFILHRVFTGSIWISNNSNNILNLYIYTKEARFPPRRGIAQQVWQLLVVNLSLNFAKYRNWGKDLYSDWMAEYFGEDLLVASWQNGNASNRIPSNCTCKFTVIINS